MTRRGAREVIADDSEAPVLKEVGELLAVHPEVVLAVRQNSGGIYRRAAFMWFYRVLRKPEEVAISDYWGFLRDGTPYALECKKPAWKKPSNEREKQQAAFLRLVECVGGKAGFVRSAEEAKALLG